MKTAMQELRNKVVSWVDHGGSDDLLIVIIAIDKWGMEKEKEQIMNAFYADADTNNCKYEDNEDYYNQTYN